MLIHLHVSLRVSYLIDRYICRMQTDRKKSAHQKQIGHILLQNLEKADTPKNLPHSIASGLSSKPKNRLQQPHRCKTDTQKPAHPGPWATMDCNWTKQSHRCKTDTQKPTHPGPWATMDSKPAHPGPWATMDSKQTY